jgi:hypothetical protein
MANRRHFEQARRKNNPDLMQDKSDSELAGIAFGSPVKLLVERLGGRSERLLEFDSDDLTLEQGIGRGTATRIEAAVLLAARWVHRKAI